MANADEVHMLPADFKRLLEAIAEFDDRYRSTLSGTADAADVSSETWHDNPAFDEIQQQAKMSFNQLKKLEAVKKSARVVRVPPEGARAQIGSRLTVAWGGDISDTDTIVLTGYIAPGSPDEEVSTTSPLGALLLGVEAGVDVTGVLNDRTVELAVLDVKPATEYFAD